MKRWSRALLLAALLWNGPLPAAAQQDPDKAAKAPAVPVLFRLTCWEVDDKTYADLRGKARVDLKEVRGRRIQEAELLTTSGRDSLVHVGQKEPIIYYDPRASQFQVQHVDTGFKLDVEWDGDQLEVRPELSEIESMVISEDSGRVGRYPRTHVQISELVIRGVRLGHTYLIGAGAGAVATNLTRVLDPKPRAANLVLTLTLEAP